MKVAKEFKYWGNGNSTSQGYYAEVDLSEFPGLESMARESLQKNELVHQFLSYLAIKRAYEAAAQEGTITAEQLVQLLLPFKAERKFENQIKNTEAQLRGPGNIHE